MDERGRIRAPFHGKATLSFGDRIYDHELIENISLNGAFINSAHRPDCGEFCYFNLFLGEDEAITLKIKAKVVRHDTKGFAITFEEMGIEAFEHLKNIVAYNSSEPNDFFNQCSKRPGFK